MAGPAQAGAGAVPGDETMIGEESQDNGHMPLSFWQSAAASLQGQGQRELDSSPFFLGKSPWPTWPPFLQA